ncbi:phenylacetic acid degradation bifunctional protein PaaZ [Gulosibacter chungangensis]|uniref:Phenylacetic acid degradation bifunctional protein PaaZ n=1 Tax=Gulosibacter chungangensis TaxID=979746 RepID=A0A7J5BCS8_9MICO|nr:phenylacetic acid degradation bifunctional protein PaaZ [Gulosibacter chungangensis]KAB1644018.1 phenylacetic acid degradation bifunctional protein PaaZ [Gulosibacter chungangensis]
MTDTMPQSLAADIVPSYVCGAWWTPPQGTTGTSIRDTSTGAEIARVSSEGLDTARVIEYARTVGRDGLGALTIHQRALKLKELALYLNEHKQSLYDLSMANGATKGDCFFDVDGGIGVLFTMSSKGRRELPNSNVIIDGAVEPMSKDGSFIGEHIYSRIPGVTVEINAFNFPVWGMLEKFAPAFVAGVPSIVKPATPTSNITAACVKLIIDSGILPEGSLQLIAGSARDLLDHLDYRDMVTFTGSKATADRLRQHPNVQEGGVRFTAEADSLNAAILGSDVTPEAPEFPTFIRAVANEMQVKAGQKCTAIRRVIVPHALVEPVVDALAARLAEKVTVGDPRVEGTTMGALASFEQLRDVRAAVDSLVAAGGQIAYGSNAWDAEQRGAFLSPVVLKWDDNRVEALHSTEAFGPVTSVLGYDTVAEAVELAAMGDGSLVATVCSYDMGEAGELARGIAGYHGRIHMLNRDNARTSTGHGAPLPTLVHGGPGRAGGGEELGGVRGIKHYMQRTAIQGTPDLLTAVTGQWHRGAAQNRVGDPAFGGTPEGENGAIHPFRKSLETLQIGDAFVSGLRQATEQEITDFANTTGDVFYAHTDPVAAAVNPFFPGIVAHGYLLVSWAAGLFVAPGRSAVYANYGMENLRFITPVGIDDSIRVELTAKRITPRETEDYGEVVWDALLLNQNEEIVATYDVLTLVAKREEQALGGENTAQ